MNLGHQQFATMDGLSGHPAEMAGIGKKLKKLRRKVSKVARKVTGADLVKKAIGKKRYASIKKRGQKLEKFGKRHGMAIAGAVATVATGGAAAPAVIGSFKSIAAGEAVRKIAAKRNARKQKKMMRSADRQIDREAAAYEASLARQDAAAEQQASATEATAASQDTDAAPAEKKSGSGWVLPAALMSAAAMALV